MPTKINARNFTANRTYGEAFKHKRGLDMLLLDNCATEDGSMKPKRVCQTID
jgi:hypothetical protein